jgi:hypothetical protein
MNTFQIDIGHVLAKKAGLHLVSARDFAQQITHKDINEESLVARGNEIEQCIEAVILFQAAMEAVINEEIDSHQMLVKVKEENELLYKKFRSLSFKNKWERSFEVLTIKDKGGCLKNYLQFYTSFRVPITHPRSRYIQVDNLTFENVYEGMKSGWKAAELLYRKLKKKNILGTWEDFCIEIGLPAKK